MRLKDYDEALKQKLSEIYPNVVFGPLSKAFEYQARQSRISNSDIEGNREIVGTDMIVQLPVIVFDRINNNLYFERPANDPAIRRGRFQYRGDNPVRDRVFPVNVMYQIDVISDKRNEVDDIWSELSMFLYCHPEIDVHYTYNGEEKFEQFPLTLMDTDNVNDVDSFDELGRVYRQTLSVEVHDAKLLFISDASIIERIPIRIIALDKDEDNLLVVQGEKDD